MAELGIITPVIINRNYIEDDSLLFQLKSASDMGLLLIDGWGDGIWLRNAGLLKTKNIVDCSFAILQASRVRTTKTEYISCPSCGRTLFDLQTTTARIKEKTSHLKHLKIGIMGCIVNGPGEMADADYGYVGAAAGKVNLYKGKEVMKKNISAEEAVNELIILIKENGDWKEPEAISFSH
jgi:(E)-4-hydroxy-3-methylbut-2-enyl-diphosphate synthase